MHQKFNKKNRINILSLILVLTILCTVISHSLPVSATEGTDDITVVQPEGETVPGTTPSESTAPSESSASSEPASSQSVSSAPSSSESSESTYSSENSESSESSETSSRTSSSASSRESESSSPSSAGETSRTSSASSKTETPSYATGTDDNPTTTGSTTTISRSKSTLANTGSDDTTSTGSNYVVFATLNQKNNTLAYNMFYTGILCVALGVIGITVLIVLQVRKKKYGDERDGIFEEIEQAEIRGGAAAQTYDESEYNDYGSDEYYEDGEYYDDVYYDEDGYEYHEEGETFTPQESDMYTQEFDVNEPYEGEDYSQYADDYDDSYDNYQDKNYDPPSSESHTSSSSQKKYDTEEILREALNFHSDEE